ncbi:MAG: hypothetical protein WBB01_06415 [Phormidesmis sp.]
MFREESENIRYRYTESKGWAIGMKQNNEDRETQLYKKVDQMLWTAFICTLVLMAVLGLGKLFLAPGLFTSFASLAAVFMSLFFAILFAISVYYFSKMRQ